MSEALNPFLINGYLSPEYFCDREKESASIISALKNGRNLTLKSPRRMGKTGLIKHVFHQLEQGNKGIVCFYIDIYPTKNLNDFVNVLSKHIIGKLDSSLTKMGKSITQFIKNSHLVLSYDPITGAPQTSITVQPSQTESTLDGVFEYLKSCGKECYIAIDEFQQINEYPEKGTEALLRSHIQFCNNVHFIFSGSKQHLMADMFSSPKRPFYSSTDIMTLKEIAPEKYYTFAKNHLKKAKADLKREVFDYIYNTFEGHTWYIQNILNRIYEYKYPDVTIEDINAIVAQIVDSKSDTYESWYNLLTLNQAAILKAIAHEGVVAEINANDFVRKYGLKGSSSNSTAVLALVDKELVYKDSKGYRVYDRFMEIWLRSL